MVAQIVTYGSLFFIILLILAALTRVLFKNMKEKRETKEEEEGFNDIPKKTYIETVDEVKEFIKNQPLPETMFYTDFVEDCRTKLIEDSIDVMKAYDNTHPNNIIFTKREHIESTVNHFFDSEEIKQFLPEEFNRKLEQSFREMEKFEKETVNENQKIGDIGEDYENKKIQLERIHNREIEDEEEVEHPIGYIDGIDEEMDEY